MLGRSNVIVNMKAFCKLQSATKNYPDLVFWIKVLDCFWGFLSYPYYPCFHPDQKFHKHLTWECSMPYQALGRLSAKWILRSVQKRAEIQWTKVHIDDWVYTCTDTHTHIHILPLKSHGCVLIAQLCWILCKPMDYSLPGSSVHGILRQKYWRGLPCPPLGHFPNPWMELPLSSLLHW